MGEENEGKRAKVARFAVEGAALLAVAAQKVITRTLWWGGIGALLGVGTFAALYLAGWLLFPWPAAQPWLIGLLGLLYPVAGAGCLGYAGFWRGVGRFTLVVGVERGWVVTLLDKLLDGVTRLMRKVGPVERAMDAGELWAENLPLERWETLLKQASTRMIGEDTGRWGVMHLLRRFVVHQVERVTLWVVRAEVHEGGGGGVSMERVRKATLRIVEAKVSGAVIGLMRRQTVIFGLAFVGMAALPPVVAWIAWKV